ncbi:restriction endonuclease subunit S [Shewanella baltica]|uniref:restriction endonuclease subunit S n=1 Tax=Shewanella baltica TaxID=62322 RepID=UPI00217E5D9B|nr:restriction endonuclease subunit S [Shewanella baltica]MCS6208046.1 restriction endonuclease subunit S [Shewanella baltica]
MADLSTPTNDAQSEQTAESLITMTAKDGGNVDHAGAIIDHIDIWTTAIEQKSSAGRGSSNKFSLYGIKKLRELILELAVRGKLVPQASREARNSANYEPASVLLERIAAEKAQLVKEGKLKKQKPLPEIREDEKSFELPVGWEWVRLQDIIQISSGKNLTSKTMIHDGGVPVYGGNGIAGYHDTYNVSSSTLVIGRVGFYCGSVHITPDFAWVTDNAFITRFNEASLFIEFLYWLFKATDLSKNDSATAQPVISGSKVYPIVVAIPPTEEQHRIVAKVDELMSLCDALEAQTEASISAHQTLVETLLNALLLPQATANTASQCNVSLEPSFTNSFVKDWQRVAEHFDTLFTTAASIDTLKQTILQLAVMGKLVKQNPNDEPAAKLLERIAKEKVQQIKEGKIKKQKPLPAITDEEKPFELPQGWEWVRFGTLFKSFSNGLYKPAKFYTDDGVISLRMYNIQSGMIDFRGAKRVEVEPNELAQFLLEPNDLLINRVNSKELVGKTAIIPITEEPLVYESMNMRAKPFSEYLSAKYLNLFMMTGIVQESISTFAKEAIGQASINQGQVSSIKTPLPPLEEQNRIVAKVDELMTLCDQLKARLSDAQTTQLHLTDAIVEQVV